MSVHPNGCRHANDVWSASFQQRRHPSTELQTVSPVTHRSLVTCRAPSQAQIEAITNDGYEEKNDDDEEMKK